MPLVYLSARPFTSVSNVSLTINVSLIPNSIDAITPLFRRFAVVFHLRSLTVYSFNVSTCNSCSSFRYYIVRTISLLVANSTAIQTAIRYVLVPWNFPILCCTKWPLLRQVSTSDLDRWNLIRTKPTCNDSRREMFRFAIEILIFRSFNEQRTKGFTLCSRFLLGQRFRSFFFFRDINFVSAPP